jgi:hypothetical protein
MLPFLMELRFLGLYYLIHFKCLCLEMNLLIGSVEPFDIMLS